MSDERQAIMIHENGRESSFYCSCGCNVFHHPADRPDRYECNSCRAWYFDAGDESVSSPLAPTQEGA